MIGIWQMPARTSCFLLEHRAERWGKRSQVVLCSQERVVPAQRSLAESDLAIFSSEPLELGRRSLL